MIRLTSFLWLWFQCVCPLMPSCSTYHLTWVSLTLDMGNLFMVAPAKCSHLSLPQTRVISSQPPLLTLNVEYLLSALLPPRSCRSLNVGLLLLATAPDLGRGVATLGHANHDGVITRLKPDILECEVRWALGSITTNNASRGDGIPVELSNSKR